MGLDPDDADLNDPDFLGRTIIGQRRALADLLRLQIYGFSWAATGIDQAVPEEIPLRADDLEPDVSCGDPRGRNDPSHDHSVEGTTEEESDGEQQTTSHQIIAADDSAECEVRKADRQKYRRPTDQDRAATLGEPLVA